MTVGMILIFLPKNLPMENISLRTVAHQGAGEKIHHDAVARMKADYGIASDLSVKYPLIILFLTGGSEAAALRLLDASKFQLLVAYGRSNAFASAMEVKAYSLQQGYRNVLLSLDDEQDRKKFMSYLSIFRALERINEKRLGLLGEVSDWLVASVIDGVLLKEKLGIALVEIPWRDAGDFRGYDSDHGFPGKYDRGAKLNIEDAGRVESMLKDLIMSQRLDAITVECFSLVQEHGVTACLGLSFLNDLGIPSGCEGDLCSIVGMMVAQEVLGIIPWMANVAGIKGNEVLLAHCTAPTNLLSSYEVDTHYETGKGTAVKGNVDAAEVTLFRLSNRLDRLFYALGRVVEGPYEQEACRTQLRVVLEDAAVEIMKSRPLGNHHLVLPGNRMEELGLLADILFRP